MLPFAFGWLPWPLSTPNVETPVASDELLDDTEVKPSKDEILNEFKMVFGDFPGSTVDYIDDAEMKNLKPVTKPVGIAVRNVFHTLNHMDKLGSLFDYDDSDDEDSEERLTQMHSKTKEIVDLITKSDKDALQLFNDDDFDAIDDKCIVYFIIAETPYGKIMIALPDITFAKYFEVNPVHHNDCYRVTISNDPTTSKRMRKIFTDYKFVDYQFKDCKPIISGYLQLTGATLFEFAGDATK